MSPIVTHARPAGRAMAALCLGTVSAIALSASPASAQAEQPAGEEGEAIIVTGSALQNQAEIATRREATAIVDSLSRDEIGALPDITIAESLRRITGVTTIYNDDIGQFASIRGTHPDFIPVTLNGMTVATTGDLGEGTRKVNLQVIPTEAVQQLRAFKTLSPDLDAGALGGLIDIATVSAFDPTRSLLSVTASASYTSYMEVPDDNSMGDGKDSPFGPSISAMWAPRFADDTLGLVVTGMYEVRPRTQSNDAITNRLYFTQTGAATTPEADNWNGYAAPNSFVSHNYTNKFTKYGGTARLDYRPSDSFQTSLFGFAYFSEEQETRNTNRVYNLDQARDQTESTGTMRVRAADVQWRYNTFERDQWGLQWLNELDLGDSGQVSARAAYTNAWFRSDRPFVTFVFNPNTRLAYDVENREQPFTVVDETPYVTPANYKTGELYDDTRDAESNVYEGRVDYRYNDGEDDRGFGFAAGALYREMDLTRDNTATYWQTGTVTLQGISFIPDFETTGYSLPALWLDQDKFWNEVVPTLPENTAQSDRQSRINDYAYDEQIAAGYVNGTYTSDTLRLDLGARIDQVDYSAEMAQLVGGVLQPEQVRYEGSDTNLLPYATANLSLTDSLRLKAGASQTLGRPNPETIATVEQVDATELEITRGNPNIKPRKSLNLDLGLEYYFNGGNGMLTVTGFYKDISDDILTISTMEEIDGDTWTVTQPVNGESTAYQGIEAGLINNSFANVHEALRGFGASANVMWVKGSSSFVYNGEERDRDQLQFQADFAANAAVFYSFGGGSELRMAMNHQGRYVEEYAANPWQDIYIEPFTTFDLTAKWEVTPRFQVRVEGRNIFSANRQRNTGPDHEYYRAGLEVGNTWYLRLNYRL